MRVAVPFVADGNAMDHLKFLEKSQEILHRSQQWAARTKAQVRHRLAADRNPIDSAPAEKASPRHQEGGFEERASSGDSE
jgi:hypothetical protein